MGLLVACVHENSAGPSVLVAPQSPRMVHRGSSGRLDVGARYPGARRPPNYVELSVHRHADSARMAGGNGDAVRPPGRAPWTRCRPPNRIPRFHGASDRHSGADLGCSSVGDRRVRISPAAALRACGTVLQLLWPRTLLVAVPDAPRA